jgi:hypothetical protein
MATQADPLNDFCWLKDGPIPPVDPADLKSIWAMQEELKRDFEKRVPNRAPNQDFSVSINNYKRVCSPGANVGALWYRLSILETRNAATCQRSHRNEFALATSGQTR